MMRKDTLKIHKKVKNLLGAYLDGELKGRLKKLVEEHLKECKECSDELQALKQLQGNVKSAKLTLPNEDYWDNFPERVMRNIKRTQAEMVSPIRVPRLRWEIAGGVIVILLTFIVTKEVLFNRMGGIEPYFPTHKVAVEKERIFPKGGYPAEAGSRKELARSETSQKPGWETNIRETQESEQTLDKTLVSKAVQSPQPVTPHGYPEENKSQPISDEMKQAEQKTERAIGDEEIIVPREKKTKLSVLIKEKEELLKTTKDKESLNSERKQLLILLYKEAYKTKKKDDINRVLKEIEIYKDSFAVGFKDTLISLSDSLRSILQAVEKEENK